MKIKINSKKLKQACIVAIKASALNATIPTMELFKIFTHNDSLYIAATNGSLSISAPVLDAEIEEIGGCLVHAKTFTNIISKLESDIFIETKGKSLDISSGETNYTLSIQKVENFPEIPLVRKGDNNVFAIEGKYIVSAVKKVCPFAKAPNGGSKPQFGGILMKSTNGCLDIVGCDGYHIAKVSVEYDSNDFEAIIPKETLATICSLINDDDEIKIISGRNNFRIIANGYTFVVRKFDGEYVEYNSVFETAMNSTILNVAASKFYAALDEATPIIDNSEKTPVIFEIGKNQITIRSVSSLGKVKTSCPIDDGKINAKLIIGANSAFIFDALKGIENADEMNIGVSSPTSPIIFTENNYSALVLPMRIKGGN